MIDDLKPYKKYKASKLRWLGSVPNNWDELRAKYVFREVDERSVTGAEELLSVSHKTGVTPRSEKNVTMFLAESNVGHKLCRPGDLAINTMWAWMAALGVSRHTGLVSPSYGVYRRIKSSLYVRDEYLDRLLRTEAYRSEFVVRSTGVNSSRLRLYPEDFLRIPLVIPPEEEQAAIVRYLNHLDHKVNHFIRAKKKQIALLNEQKHAIIHGAVTRGLDPNVKLRPSGVGWFPQIPVHWEILRGRYIGRLFSTPSVADTELVESTGDGTMYLKVSDLGGLDETLTVRKSRLRLRESTTPATKLNKPILVFPKRGGAIYTNTVGLVHESCFLDPNLMGWEISDRFEPLYVALLLKSRTLADLADVSSVPQINNKHIKPTPFPAPPREEQQQLLNGLLRQLAPLNRLIAFEEREMAFVNEYRTRLVSDVVTGKLDVRAAAANLTDLSPEAEPLDESEDLLQDETAAEDLEVAEAA
jgi:type I restriction enzyme S subunit